ncbi:helix-turn-helix domain-containing protein [Streptomyces roseolilacinus]|uniref:helix-turn-helix domain-containing protein n=1 Tax=Streptomyces roseolilacinus TaxID=66904 RepID=UPI001E4B6AC6|nr:helix-turn-helix domain-containing protein [Streptomyces roseolilacinus]
MVGNHLAQHRRLSLLAMGLALHIQSLPDGARIGIRFLAARFPESEKRIADALRELEAAGYLERRRERLDCGRVVTRTVFHNQPKGGGAAPRTRVTQAAPKGEPPAAGSRPLEIQPVRGGTETTPGGVGPASPVAEALSGGVEPAPPVAEPAPPVAEQFTPPAAEPVPSAVGVQPRPAAAQAASPASVPRSPAAPSRPGGTEPRPGGAAPRAVEAPGPVIPEPRAESRPLPVPRGGDPDRLRTAADLLAGLRRDDPRLVLSEAEVRRLAPAVAAWLERNAGPASVRAALTAGLPDPLTHPAGLVAHRLTALLPPPLPEAPAGPRPDPLQTCERCDRAFRAPEPGCCRDCRPPASPHEGGDPPSPPSLPDKERAP